MSDYSVESSPQLSARTGGALYLAVIVPGVFAEAVRLLPSFIGEASLCLWLLVKGVNVQKWREANAA